MNAIVLLRRGQKIILGSRRREGFRRERGGEGKKGARGYLGEVQRVRNLKGDV